MNYYPAHRPLSTGMAVAAYDSTPVAEAKSVSHRRRMNVVPILLCIFVPCFLYAAVTAALAFSWHYEGKITMYLILIGALFTTALVGLIGYSAVRRGEYAPNWMKFLFFSMALAFFLALFFGLYIYREYMLPYYELTSLNNYMDVDPTKARGQELMDAGYIVFKNGTSLDLPKSMGFRMAETYCVAPIALTGANPDTYDFWAVGKGCCDGSTADFHCDNYADLTAKSAIRLMSDADRAYYRLAVQQAEATYKIRADHPLFFLWSHDAAEELESWKDRGHTEFDVRLACFCVFQFFLVLTTTMLFSKYA